MKHNTFIRLQSPQQLIELFVFGRRGRQVVFAADLPLVVKAWLSLSSMEKVLLAGRIAARRRGGRAFSR